MKIKKLRWYIISLVMLGTIINYLARSTLGVAAPEMMKTLNLSSEQYSWIVSVFPFTYAIGGIACGFVIDKFGLRVSFAVLAALWSLCNMLTALFSTWFPIAALRGGLGLTEAAFNPAGMKVTAEWFPAKERGLACGVYSLGTSVGAMLAPPLVVWAIAYALGRWGPSRVLGMATPADAEDLLGLTRLRRNAAIIRPDLHAPKRGRR